MVYDKNKIHILIALVVLLLASLACGLFTPGPTEEPVEPTSTTGAVAVDPTEDIVTEEPPTAVPLTETPLPTETSLPTETPPPTATPVPEPISVVNFGFGQDGISASYAFLVKNPNQWLAFEDSQYQVAAYDENDIVLETDSGYIELILPGQTIGIAGDMYLDDGVTISRIEVQLNAGDTETTESSPTFEVENIAYYPDEYFSYVTGVIHNPYEIDLSSIRLSAVMYDEDENIVGGGYTYVNFILANGITGAKVSVESTGEVASVELYPTLSGLSSLFLDRQDTPGDVSNIRLLNYGFGQESESAGIGLVIENPNSRFSIEGSQYQVAAYASDGTVLDTDDGYINLILPEQTLGLASDIYLNEGMEIDHIEVQIKDGDFVEAEPLSSFTYENVVFQPGSYSSKVTGIVVSPYTSDITDLKVSAIAYNDNGEIIGGGYTFLDFAPANSKAAVDVSVTVAGTPASVEIFATVTSLSEFSE